MYKRRYAFTQTLVRVPLSARKHFPPARCSRQHTQHAVQQAQAAKASLSPGPIDKQQQNIPQSQVETFQTTAEQTGTRIDKLLACRFKERSRSYIQSLISSGHVQIDGKSPVSKSHRVVPGCEIVVNLVPTEREQPVAAEEIPLEILYEDEHVVFVNKQAGMVVHPAPGNWSGTVVNALAHRYKSLREMNSSRAGIVHRLDKGTSGVLLAGKTQQACEKLSELFAARQLKKEYIAITVGNPAGKGCISRIIDEPVGRCPTDRIRMCVLPEHSGGRSAKSVVQVVASDARSLLHVVKVGIETGRTHQIRVHLRHARAPVLGDELYGAGDINHRFSTLASRPLLHAWKLSLRHPFTNEFLTVTSELPRDMRSLLKRVIYPTFEEEQRGW
ncbi:putative RNA pseudouridine synthase [Gracilariopsis chorda]|uniref:Pseudouridine synthase n=1 Tax=Gracilariopsis chorda TaxID=448386 RepID=A0A2V3IHS7_9FLOR|nr:putative RNA pseudouridine synthase [Gracilariopsis chorda]|eukprot:PXF41646.1 putative RNA pseudouridine synthase [Gracilariopsis chorda]